MITRRERLVELLSKPGVDMTLLEMSDELKVSVKTVIEDIDSIRKTLRREDRHIEVRPAVCVKCNFIFSGRTRISDPTKCPKCHSEQIEPQGFRISKS
ncbi:MAG: HTH domain-containing protein [Candidatus Heimdallarchaeota archaeon]